MHNFFTIETEAELRRQELERAAAADARAARASQGNAPRRWLSRFARSQESPSFRVVPAMPSGALLELHRVPRPVAC